MKLRGRPGRPCKDMGPGLHRQGQMLEDFKLKEEGSEAT